MTMHMVGPYLTTTGKKKGPEKFKSAAHKQRAEEAAEAWDDLQKRYGVDASKVDRAMKAKPYVAPQPYRRDTGPRIESKPDTIAVALKAPDKVYTGTEMIGIAQMSKSNAVPVFQQQDILDISKMRRG